MFPLRPQVGTSLRECSRVPEVQKPVVGRAENGEGGEKVTALLISFNGTEDNGQFLGDQLCSLKTAWLFCQHAPPDVDKFIISFSPNNRLGLFWQKLIDTYSMDVVYDTWNPGDWPIRHANWDHWRKTREIEGRKFTYYRELHRRCGGGERQTVLCGRENGLRRRNVFEYWYYGQEDFRDNYCDGQHIAGGATFDESLIYHPTIPADRGVYICPHAKCQGNFVFTFDYWEAVVKRCIDHGISVTWGHDGGHWCQQFDGHSLFKRYWGPTFKDLMDEVCRHRLVACGNTGVGWLAFACGLPVLAMQPVNSNMPDYRYEICGAKTLVEFLEQPDADYCARRIKEEVDRVLVMTTGCYDVLHAGHVRHLAEARAMGSRLVVALNSDASIKRIKPEKGGVTRPVNTQEHRASVLQAIRYVDDVRVFDGDDAMELIREMRPDVLACGLGYEPKDVIGREFVESYGGRVAITCLGEGMAPGGEPGIAANTNGLSSTRLIPHVVRQSDILKAVQDAAGVSVNPYAKLKLLADQFMTVSALPGDMADLGAYRGGCSLILRRLAPNKTLHVFDTWAGTPFDDPLCHHKKGEWVASLAECKALVGENERTGYWEGVFPYSTKNVAHPLLQPRLFCFVVVDPDTYQTVRDAIEWFWPRMVSGGKMFFDDFAHVPCAGVEKAIREKFTEDQLVIYPALCTCVVAKK